MKKQKTYKTCKYGRKTKNGILYCSIDGVCGGRFCEWQSNKKAKPTSQKGIRK